MKWSKVQRPKYLGGLGVLDLDLFGRALRLRRMWFQWTEQDRPWVGTEVSCSEVDKQFFRASTQVTVGNGRRAKFWDSSWINGQAPRDIAPQLYKLAWRKNQCVRDDLQDFNWTRGLWRMTTTSEMAEFISLWTLVSETFLNDEEDVIKWKWTKHGQYTARSAYVAQQAGSHCTFDIAAIWTAKTEGKHIFFAWLMVQNKILTTDKLQARNWPCNPDCPLCDQAPQTADHLCLQCVFAQEIWVLVSGWTNGAVRVPQQSVWLELWWNRELAGLPSKEKKQRVAYLIYNAWNIWKERNRRIFEGKSSRPTRVLQLIKDEMALRDSACGFAAQQFPV